MYQRFTAFVLRWLRVPPEPHPPHGDPASLRVFRAGKNFLNLKLFGWGVTQLLAFAGIVFWVTIFIDVEVQTAVLRGNQVSPPTLSADSFAKTMEKAGREVSNRSGKYGTGGGLAGFRRALAEIASQFPPWAFPVLWVIKIAGILAYLGQLPLTYAIARLDYEMRWYMVTDRSLRLRHGVWKVSESTMSFANIQQVVVSQGPLQRLLGLSDVKVQSAGGGGGGVDSHGNPKGGDDMHLGLFHSVTNGSEIRDLILARLRRFRESGLGDPEEKTQAALPQAEAPAAPNDLLAAAQEFAAEARALRTTLGG